MPPSPDPPRGEEDRDELGPPPEGQFIAVWDDDDIWGDQDGPYELDVGGGSEEESDFSDNEGQAQPEMTLSSGDQEMSEGTQGTTRGRYQLLIPFPQTENHSRDNDSQQFQGPSVPTLVAGTSGMEMEAPYREDVENEIQSVSEESVERDINLTEENVETIKSVMKNFSLPSAAIPPWASELSEDAWKNKLFQSLDGKKGNKD